MHTIKITQVKLLFFLLSIFISTNLFSQQDGGSAPKWGRKTIQDFSPSIGIQSEFSYKMMEQNQDLRKTMILLEQRREGALKNQSLTIGTSLISIVDYQKSNTADKFGYLMRHPTSSNQLGKEVSEVVIHSFQLSTTAAVNNWITAYADLLYCPEQSFGAGTITALTRNQIQLRKGFVVLGDLRSFPIYASLGKMDVNFGQTGSVNPFTNSTMWHAFGCLGYGGEIGFKKWGLNASFTAVQGGAQFRALQTVVGDSSNVPSVVNNFTADINQTFKTSHDEFLFQLGGSYVSGTSYSHEYPVIHFAATKMNNPAWTAYARMVIMSRLTLMGSYAETLKAWPGTFNPTPPLDIYPASKVSSIQAGAKFDINPSSKTLFSLSAEWSNFTAGPEGAPWERQNQFVAGFNALVNNSSRLFVEYFNTAGYVPLNFISGGNVPPGQTHSVRGASSNGFVIGAQINL
jgi:hypothetical protein